MNYDEMRKIAKNLPVRPIGFLIPHKEIEYVPLLSNDDLIEIIENVFQPRDGKPKNIETQRINEKHIFVTANLNRFVFGGVASRDYIDMAGLY